MKTCMDCQLFYSQAECGMPILDECVCLSTGGKNYFVDMEPCEDFREREEQK